jgi:hypothetical protein
VRSKPDTALADGIKREDIAAAAGGGAAAAAETVAYYYWGCDTVSALQQQSTTAAAAAAQQGTSSTYSSSSSGSGEAAKQQAAQRHSLQQQRQHRCRRMFAPVDAATAAAAMGLQAPCDSAGGSTAGDDSTWVVGIVPGPLNSSSSGARWVSSADVTGPSLRSWSQQTEQLGLVPEVKAVWWGLGDLDYVWGCAESGSRAAYKQYRRGLDQLLEGSSCKTLQKWYQNQQFTTPVVIGA